MDDKTIEIFSSSTITCHMKESELTRWMIQLAKLSDVYLSRYYFLKFDLLFFFIRRFFNNPGIFFLYFRIWCHPIDMTTTRVVASHKWWDHSCFVRYFFFFNFLCFITLSSDPDLTKKILTIFLPFSFSSIASHLRDKSSTLMMIRPMRLSNVYSPRCGSSKFSPEVSSTRRYSKYP